MSLGVCLLVLIRSKMSTRGNAGVDKGRESGSIGHIFFPAMALAFAVAALIIFAPTSVPVAGGPINLLTQQASTWQVELGFAFDEPMGWWVFSGSDERLRNASLTSIQLDVDCPQGPVTQRHLWLLTNYTTNANQTAKTLQMPVRTYLGKAFRIDVNRSDLSRLFRLEPNHELLHILCDDCQGVRFTARFSTANLLDQVAAVAAFSFNQFIYPF